MNVREAIEDLFSDYAALIDADRLEEWLELFAEDALYQVLPRENLERGLPASIMLCINKNMIRDRIVALRQANEYNLHRDRHLISNLRIKDQDDGTWRVAANYAVFQSTLGGETRLFSVGRYDDLVRREGDRMLFARKLAVVDTFSVPTLLATPL